MLIEISLALTAATFVKVLSAKRDKIFGIYSQPGSFYWLKWILFYALLRWRIWRSPKRSHKYDDGSDLRFVEDEEEQKQIAENDYGMGKRANNTPVTMERTQHVADSKFAIDAVYFNGFEQKKSSVAEDVTIVVAFTARFRKYAEILFFVNVPGVGFLQHPAHPDRIICDSGSDDYTYHGQGIKIEMLEPMRRWRIKYNGLMRAMDVNHCKVAKESHRFMHVKFSLIWRSFSDYINFDTDLDASCMANAFASEEWSRDFFKRVEKHHAHQTHYEQWGQLRGILQVEGRDPTEVILRGLRDHSFSRRDWRHFHRYLICMIQMDDGTCINATSICMDITLSRLTLGYIIHPNHVRENVTEVDIKLWEFGEDGEIPKEVNFTFVAGGKTYSVVCQIRLIPEFFNGFEHESRVVETLADYHVNGKPGRGIAEFCYRHAGDRRTIQDCPKSEVKRFKKIRTNPAELKRLLVLKLDDDACRKESLVGGKGCQLSVLKQWSRETDKFEVPNGFCITTNAYELHVQENTEIRNLLNQLSGASNSSDEVIRELCQKITAAFQSSLISEALREIIETNYSGINHKKQPPVAVRSSAIGEDSHDLSAAGQLETFLGVSGSQEIIQAVKKCWGCQYSYNAVKYRRQHGQPIISSMGVVIQRLVNAKVSGVMFTQHPVTGHPLHTMINSNFGLGETVVSGCAEPDTIVVACNPNNNTKIISRKLGSKKKRLSVTDSGDLETEDIVDSCSSSSLVDDEIYDLVKVGQMIQTFSGKPRDIEWAISSDGKINLLQSRPITGDPTETDYELMHEFDTAYTNDNYVLTTANIGEMMTGPITPLNSSTFGRAVDYSTQIMLDRPTPRGLREYNDIIVTQSHGHMFMNYLETLRLHDESMHGSRKDSADVNLFGEISDKLTLDEVTEYHNNSVQYFNKIRATARFWKYLLGNKPEFEELIAKAKSLKLEGKTSKDLYRAISRNLGPIYAESWRAYLGYATLSGISTTVLMMILSRGKSEWKTEHYSDVAMIYSTCKDVVSVNAPTLMRETAKHIHESDERDKFINSPPEDAIKTLIEGKSKASETFQKFLDSCGHRCIREAEFREASWARDPTKLGISLQAVVKTYQDEVEKTEMSVEEAISNIKTPLTMFGRFIMRWAIPRARKSVAGREYGKSNVIMVSNVFKEAYWDLAYMLQKEGYLPDHDLMFFLTHGEIGRLLRTRSAALVTRAMRRRRIQNAQWQLEFDMFQDKVPPVPNDMATKLEPDKNGHGLQIKGFPVSHGVVNGIARVVTTLQDACNIKRGEILIVRTTDVGWSPYFPLISGLVTEIGGLISHGAVVAREYGLPCIVGAKRATSLLKTGDSVHLDGGSGIIYRRNQE